MTRSGVTRILATLLLVVSAARAQFFDLATTGDGSVVYFATRHARVGFDEPAQGRIFRIGAEGLEVFAARDELPPAPPSIFSNFFDLSAPTISDDGASLAFAGRRSCNAGRECVGAQFLLSTIRAQGQPDITAFGRADFSPDGRFVLLHRGESLGFTSGVIDLASGVESRPVVLGSTSLSGSAIANDGTIVHLINGTINLTAGTEQRMLTSLREENVLEAVIDGAADRVAFVSRWTSFPESAFSRLRVLDVSSGSRLTIAEGLGDFFSPDISTLGERVLFRSTARFDGSRQVGLPEVFVVNTDGSGLRQLTFGEAGIRSAVLSGDGKTAYAATGLGSLIRIDVDGGTSSELIPRTVTSRAGPLNPGQPFSSFLLAAPGSLARLDGAGFADQTMHADSSPLPFSLGGFQLLLNGQPVPLLYVAPATVVYQVPWEISLGPQMSSVADIEITTGRAGAGESPFQPRFTTRSAIGRAVPHAIPTPLEHGTTSPFGAPLSLAADQNYQLVTVSNPIHSGDVVHSYATGLGPVAPALRTAEAAPAAGPLSRVVTPLSCVIFTSVDGQFQRADVPILFAGLAPGLVGIYQVSMQIPDIPALNLAAPQTLQVICEYPGLASTFQFHFPIEL